MSDALTNSMTYEELCEIVFHSSESLVTKQTYIDQVNDSVILSKISSSITRKIISLSETLKGSDITSISGNSNSDKWSQELKHYAQLQEYLVQKLIDPMSKTVVYFINPDIPVKDKIGRVKGMIELTEESLTITLSHIEQKIQALLINKDRIRTSSPMWNKNIQEIQDYEALYGSIITQLGIEDTRASAKRALDEKK